MRFLFTGKTGTNILRKVLVPIINNEECLRWHHFKGIDVKLHFEMFCAGHSEGKRDACLVSDCDHYLHSEGKRDICLVSDWHSLYSTK